MVAGSEADVRETVTGILSELGVEPDAISDTAVLGRDLELDSTDAVEVGLELKRRFNVTVKVQVKGDETVASLVGLVVSEIQGDGGSPSAPTPQIADPAPGATTTPVG
jgi:acyl carrier protein